MVIQPLSTRLIKPNFCFDLSHRRSTTVSLETRNSTAGHRLALEVLEAPQQTEPAMYLKLTLYGRNECVFSIPGVLGRSLKYKCCLFLYLARLVSEYMFICWCFILLRNFFNKKYSAISRDPFYGLNCPRFSEDLCKNRSAYS